MKNIGIIGGMGPEATSDQYMKIVRYYQKNFGAKYDKDFPAMIIYSVPIPDVVENMENEKKTLRMLSDAAKLLEKGGSDFIVIACNTVQFLLKRLRKNVEIPIIGIAEVSSKYVKTNGYEKVGILGTNATVFDKEVYDNDFQKVGVKLIKPRKENQNKVTRIIMNQLADRTTEKERRDLREVIQSLNSRGSEAILIACTDLPPIISQENFEIPIIDCTQIYADEAARLSTFKSKSNNNVGGNR
ncbi:MAG: amino acid racemase [Candidatus Aenigmarchaeota archaeon]|nr:amino acid racemase [Candidatus Aenigmarchaeota archaeon]